MDWSAAEAFNHDKLAVDGKAGVTKKWCESKGPMPAYVLIRAKLPKGKRRPAVFKSFLRDGEDEDIVLHKNQTSDFPNDSKTTTMGFAVEYKEAGSASRFWYKPGAVLGAVGAVTAWLATVAAAVFAFLNLWPSHVHRTGSEKAAGWVLVAGAVVLFSAAVAATVKLVQDIREARQ
jgi:hypothetical protein